MTHAIYLAMNLDFTRLCECFAPAKFESLFKNFRGNSYQFVVMVGLFIGEAALLYKDLNILQEHCV